MKSHFLLLFFIASTTLAQQLAFPTAEGGGRFAVGGRGGTVYEVTNLNDSGAGSLRDAVSQPNRIVVFRVSGVINLKSRLAISKNNITIAGQTAPGHGICLTGYTLNIQASNIVVRYIRCRLGDANDIEDDAMNCWNGPYENIIIDHCSLGWSVDETATFYGIKNFTLQWSLIAESLFNSVHQKGQHGYGGIWGGFNATFHHNLIAHHTNRNPRLGGARKGYTPYPNDEIGDLRNNVIYNWGGNSVYGGEGGRYNIVNNYYKAGPATSGNATTSSATNNRNRILQYTNMAVDGTDTTWGGKFYINGNFVAGFADVTADNWTKGVQKDNNYAKADALIAAAKQSQAFATPPVRTQTAEAAYASVLDSVGAILPRRDALDVRYVNETRTGTATYNGSTYTSGVSKPTGIIDTPSNVGGLPAYLSSTAPTDTDHDGMSDDWEKANGLNANDATDGPKIATNGYSNVENYINNITKDTGTGALTDLSGKGSNTATNPIGADFVVTLDGTGNFNKIQLAIDAAPASSTKPFVILIKNGFYKEKITIPSNKPFIHLVGESAAGVIISWDDYSGKINPAGGTFGTSNSATLTINSNDCLLYNLTVENTTGDAPQALAIALNGDRIAVKLCRFLGGQDTVLANQDGRRQYFNNCYIDGVVDFIFGSAIAVFDSCVVHAKTRVDGLSGSYITAANTPNGQNYGYVFRDCLLPPNRGTTAYVLGRPWQNDASTADAAKKYNKVVFLNTTMGNAVVQPIGWAAWDAGTNTSIITYAEYNSKKYDGKNVDVSKRISWSKQLTATQAAQYNNANIFGTWIPNSLSPFLTAPTVLPIAITNLKLVKSGTNATITWNRAWNVKDVKYEVLRSVDSKTAFSVINTMLAQPDSIIHYTFTEPIPAPGKTHYYIIRGSKTGLATHTSDTLMITSTPTIVINSALTPFLQGVGLPSASQVYNLAGDNLPNSITITPPTNFEVSIDNGKTWAASAITLTPTNGILTTTNILARLNAKTAGDFSGKITHTSNGATTQEVSVSGKTQAEPLPIGKTLAFWSMKINANDSTALRARGAVTASPIFKRLFLANGTVIPAYSTVHGQAFAPSTDGGGLWTTAGGGFGNNLNANLYQQFTIKPQKGFTMRVDSLVFKCALFAAATGKLAIKYSKSAFKSDSSDITGGLLANSPLPIAANGKFVTPVLLVNEAESTNSLFRFALNGSLGINLAEGDSLTMRLYYSTGSSSTGRYAKIKEMDIKGSVTEIITGIVPKKNDNEVYIVFPNPAKTTLTLKSERNLLSTRFQIVDINGRTSTPQLLELSTHYATFNIENLRNGTYFLKGKDTNREFVVKFGKE